MWVRARQGFRQVGGPRHLMELLRREGFRGSGEEGGGKVRGHVFSAGMGSWVTVAGMQGDGDGFEQAGRVYLRPELGADVGADIGRTYGVERGRDLRR